MKLLPGHWRVLILENKKLMSLYHTLMIREKLFKQNRKVMRH